MGQVSGRERHSSHSEPPVGRQRPLSDLGSSSDLRRALRNIRRRSSISLRGAPGWKSFGAWMHLSKYPGLLIETIGERRREITWTGPSSSHKGVERARNALPSLHLCFSNRLPTPSAIHGRTDLLLSSSTSTGSLHYRGDGSTSPSRNRSSGTSKKEEERRLHDPLIKN